MLETSTSSATASALIRAAIWTAIPPTSSPEELDLPAVQPDPHLETNVARRLGNRMAAVNRARGPIERRQASVAEHLHLASAEPLRARVEPTVVMRREKLAPARVPELRGSLGRADDVREHHCREHALGLGDRASAGQEFLDLP